MTGQELRAARERAGATRQRVAEIAGVSLREVEDWETFGTIPPRRSRAIRMALWEMERDQELERSRLPACEWIASWERTSAHLPADKLIVHIESCPLCKARADHVAKHVSPQPIGGGPLARVLGVFGQLSGWRRSAFGGAMMALLIGGWGVPAMLLRGIIKGLPVLVWGAVWLLFVLLLSGAAAGVAHYNTSRLRSTGRPGHYASWILAMYAYLAAVYTLSFLTVAVLGRGLISERDLETLSDPLGIASILLLGGVLGLIAGRVSRPGGRALAAPRPRRILSFRNVALASGLLLALVRILTPSARPPSLAQAESALPGLRAAAEQSPDDLAAQKELARNLGLLGRWQEATPVLERAAVLKPDDPEVLWQLGLARRYAGEHEQAIAAFQQAAALAPYHPETRYQLAWTLYDLNRLEEAEAEFRAATRLAPRVPAGYAGLGRVLTELGRPVEAETPLRRAIGLDPADPRHHRSLAVALEEQDELAQALAAYEEAARLDPAHPALWGDIGRVANQLGQYDRSSAAFERLNELDAGSAGEGTLLGEIWVASKRGERY